MDNFEIGDSVVVQNLKYAYPDFPWIESGLCGHIIQELPTNNKRGAKRYLIYFPGIDKEAKLYSDEIGLLCKNKVVEKECNQIMDFVNEIENDIVKEFYTTSLKNIESKYEKKIQEIKKGDPVNSLFHTTKKELSEKLNIPINSLKIAVTAPLQGTIFLSTGTTPIEEFNDFCLIDGEPFSRDIKEAISDFSEKKKIEVEQLNDLCKKADTVVSYAEDYDEICNILNEYKIMNCHKINEVYGLEKNNSKKGE